MATVGHTIVGMTLATLPARPGRKWAAWWPGLLVLAAHFLDIGEWTIANTWSRWGSWHMLHTWPAALGCAAGGSVLLGLIGRVKRLGPHVLLWIAVLSHLPMDSFVLNTEIRRWYRDPPPNSAIDAKAVNLPAETWCYGVLLISSLLLLSAGRFDRPLNARRVAVLLLLALPVTFFLPFVRTLWMCMYVAAAVFAVWMIRPRPRWGWLANAVLVAPILILAGVEAYSWNLASRGERLMRRGNATEAIDCFRRANLLPTRTDKTINWWRIGLCQERLGNLVEAEKSLTRSFERDREWHWSEFELAEFYMRHPGTAFHRPETAAEYLRMAIQQRPPHIQDAARKAMERYGFSP